ncbi:MAG: helix-turn-helix transcriptional regulator [Erysipelotrichales bacterium]
MDENVFSKKFITLRKKFNLTQQEIADRLNVSNKTVSRWETAEGYPDIDLLPKIASIFHVSIDYLLKDHDDFKEIDKVDIISYFPWLISLFGVVIFYSFCALTIPIIFNFIIYYFIVKFSYHFLKQYTDRKNGNTLVNLNTVSIFFVASSLLSNLFILIVIMDVTGNIIIGGNVNIDMMNSSQFMLPYFCGYIIAAIYAFIHYKGHKTEEYCQSIKNQNEDV